ncbi:MAG: 5-formyltetrahydrofolate cyclo-ligase [Bacteroidales bacterium]|nr:5-formyltetrahydrofolate cyclo-ligase [Bacteroidales bacterium]MDY0217296.1 5-formyltetrahydrofolate cyclo-ligase [Bacteroidales bacterium]
MENKIIREQKIELRKQIRSFKRNFTQEQRSEQSHFVVNEIEKHPDFLKSNIVMAYWAMKDELDLSDLILKWQDKKQFLLPCVNGDELEIRRFQGLDSLAAGTAFGILEPIGDLFTDYKSIDLVLVPGLAFDSNNNRMGRGKAYYDKFLVKTNAVKMGVCFDFQFVESVPVSAFDVKMDAVMPYQER